MSNLKRYACQTGKIIIGLPIVTFVILTILTFAWVASEVICYMLFNFRTVQVLIGLVVLLFVSFAAFCIGNEIFRKYNICQRFK